jgi:hypothetical protein
MRGRGREKLSLSMLILRLYLRLNESLVCLLKFMAKEGSEKKEISDHFQAFHDENLLKVALPSHRIVVFER